MNSLPRIDGNEAQGVAVQDQMDTETRLRYRQVLRRRRTRIICIKLLANILFLFAWSFVTLNDNTYKWITLLGGNFWTDFDVYAGVSACLPLFSFIGLLRKGILVSQVWFEVVWLLAVSGFDSFLIWRQTVFWPPFKDWALNVFDDPYLTVSIALYVLTVTGLAIDLAFSLLWSGDLSRVAWQNRGSYAKIWFSHAADFPWLLPNTSPNRSPSLLHLVFGTVWEPPASRTIPKGIRDWLMGSTMFRRFGTFEPLSHSITRGFMALLFWIVLLAYGILNCAINPIRQFTLPKGLPTKSLTQDSRAVETFGHISGFIALDVVPYSQYATADGWKYPPGMCDAIRGGIKASVTDPSNDQVTDCNIDCSGLSFWNQYRESLQVEAVWDCGSIWDPLRYQTSAPAPDVRPYVSVVWDSSAYQAQTLLNAGFLSVPITRDETDYSSVVSWGTDSPREWKHGVTFNFTAGQTVRVDVGRRRIYANRATFLDLIGISQAPDVYVTYPILSLTPTASPSPQLTTLNFYPGFGAYEDEIYEEYLEHTVLSGLSTTGGLYSSFEVVFILIFGRSLIAALFGGKHVTTFGAIASILSRDSFRQRLLEEYPGIDGKDPAQRAYTTCKFLHDFVLDLKPLEIPYTETLQESGRDTNNLKPNLDAIEGKLDIEVAQKTAPNLSYAYRNSVNPSV